ncbi:MAG: hypothetical protein JOZ85_15435, partial [Betaproteobacteria bacterium]|nr:hypothetical protein [Betaproteobacteria bacterium]
MMAIAYVVLEAGFLVLRFAKPGDMPAPAAWVLGVFVSSIAVYALVASLEILAATAFAVWAAIVITAAIAVRGRAPEPRLRASELTALALCALATLFWCWDIAGASQSYLQREILTTWTDQFAHAGVISQFGDPRAAGHQAIELADVPRPPYHYGSYMLPAALAGPLDLPGLSLATAVW